MTNNKQFDVNKDYWAVFDADTLLHSSAVICERRYIIAKHKATDTQQRFDNVTQFKGRGLNSKPGAFGQEGSWIYSLNEKQLKTGHKRFTVGEFEIIQEREQVEDLQVAKAAINNQIKKLCLLPWINFHKLKLVIGGCDTDEDYEPNFRYEVAKSFPYKGRRGEKPIVFQELRKWFINKYKDNVVLAQGMESDDYLSVFNYWCNDHNQNCVLIYLDKDLCGIPNHWWFNYTKLKDVSPKELQERIENDSKFEQSETLHLTNPIYIDKFTADYNFWTQILKGDMGTDNIPGLIGKGSKFAEAALADCKTEKEMAEKVIEAYKEYANLPIKGGKQAYTDMFVKNEYNHYKDWKCVLNEQYLLLRMREDKNRIITLDEHLNRLGVKL